jgi:hypothetical protein
MKTASPTLVDLTTVYVAKSPSNAALVVPLP